MTEIIQKIDDLLTQIRGGASIRESLEWYLKNNLINYRRAIEEDRSARDIDNATRVFARFCTESMDWDTPLYRSCMEIAEIGGKLAKT
jgi:hypothetical protein